MAIAAWALAILGGLSAVMGIITATEAIPFLADLPAQFTALFWVALGAVLLLGCLVFKMSRSEYE
jgi:hypothetical protein